MLLQVLAPTANTSPSSLREAEQQAVVNLTAKLAIVDEVQEELGAVRMELGRIKAKSRYTTQDEHDIGDLILKDLGAKTLDSFALSVSLDDAVDMKLLQRMEGVPGKEEDKAVNGPLHRFITELLPTGYQAKLTINNCKLVDNHGREQREDILLLEGNAVDEEWADLVTMVVGKTKLDTNGWKIALGQAMRRAGAILECQPWRQFVILPISDITSIGYLRLEQDTWKPAICQRQTLFPGFKVGQGAGQFLGLIAEPSLFGFIKCPISLVPSSVSLQPKATQSKTLFARLDPGRQRAVFLATFDDDTMPVVVKACKDAKAIDDEATTLKLMESVPGVLRCIVPESQTLTVLIGEVRSEWHGLLLQPYCTRLRPTVASKNLFAQYARTLAAAHDMGVCHNDISLNNLLVTNNDQKDSKDGPGGIVADWGIASKPGDPVLAATVLFAPDVRLSKTDISASQIGDFESLYYVAVCCAAREIPWARALQQGGEEKMV
jgi:hypothetical protein